MDTQMELGTSSDKPKFEMLLVDEKDAQLHKADLERLLAGKVFNAPVLYTIDQAVAMVANGRMQLWMIRQVGDERPCLFMLTEIIEYPAGRTINICLTAGSKMLPAAKQLFTLFLAWAMRRKVDYIECTTKPSIMRVLERFGFSVTGVRLHYPLKRMQ